MDPRRHSVPYDASYPAYPHQDAYDPNVESSLPTHPQHDAYDPRRSVYRKARDPSQSFTKRSSATAAAGGDDSYARRIPPQEYRHSGPPIEPSASASQDVDYFEPSMADLQELRQPPQPPNGTLTNRTAQKDPRTAKNQQTRSRPASLAYPPPIQTQSAQYRNNPPSGEYEVSPISPGTAARNVSGGSVSSSRRRGSVPHRSPLQKLEGKLDDISKEEKRARLEEAEHQARQRVDAQKINGMTYDHFKQDSPQQSSSGPNSRASASGQSRRSRTDPRDIPRSSDGSRQDSQRAAASQVDQHPSPYSAGQRGDGTHDLPNARTRRKDVSLHDTNYAAGLTERTPSYAEGTSDPLVSKRQGRYYGDVNPDVGPAVADDSIQTTSKAREPKPQATPSSAVPERSSSRRLQKKQPENHRTGQRDPKAMSDAHKQLQSERMGGHSKSAAAIFRNQQPDPLPREAVKNESKEAPTYTVPPQTSAGQHAREQVGLHPEEHQAQSERATQAQGHHHFSNILHRNRGPVRQYQAPKPLEEWRQAGIARLLGSDIDLEEVDAREDRNKTWWEQGDSKRRSSYSKQEKYDGIQEDKDDRATFNPPLYLRCGPLLRYTGMRREQSSRTSRHASGEREIWRGSVMIVTSDAQSSYDRTPTLRLFVQPRDLLPPPPAQVDEVSGQHLEPEYIDPLAGLPKLSRTGKLVYVRPVEQLDEEVDYSRIENDEGLFESVKLSQTANGDGPPNGQRGQTQQRRQHRQKDGEMHGKFREVKAARLHAERGLTFWRFNLEIELGSEQTRVAYRINRGPAIGFWVPARGQTMNIMFHSCNGFSLSVDSNHFSGPDPLWRDVLNGHQTRPFHVMIGGGDQIYNDRCTRDTALFQDWLAIKNPEHKHAAHFTAEMQDELEDFYLNRYSMWFSQGLFGMANSQIPMINVWDDHDIIDVSD